MVKDDTSKALTDLEGGHGLPLSVGNASLVLPQSRYRNVTSCLGALPLHATEFRLRKTGDLEFEPRLTDPESVVLPLHQSPRERARTCFSSKLLLKSSSPTLQVAGCGLSAIGGSGAKVVGQARTLRRGAGINLPAAL